MTMLTRCAACGTTFRITTEQLVSHQGKVRCGACGEVFNALQNLVHSRTAAEAEADASQRPDTTALDETSDQTTSVSTALAAPGHATADVVLNGPATLATNTNGRRNPSDAGGDEFVGSGGDGASVGSAPLDTALTTEPVLAEATPTAHDGVARRATKFPWWSLAGAVLAITALGAQAAYFYRNEAAARLPEAKPWLELMCKQVGCKVDVLRDAQAISIESSDLQADSANRNLLTLVALLRNRAGFAQDAPHLELTLTDAQDVLVARRVLAPLDYFAAAPFAAGSEIQMRIVIDAGQLKASGYRLYAFYP